MSKRVFGYTDIHWMDRDERALAVAMKAQVAFAPDRTIIGGDLLDCTQFSRHPKQGFDDDVQADYMEGEVEPANEFLDFVQDNTGGGGVDFIEGNHDAWFERWIANQPNGGAFRSLSPRRVLSKGRKGFRWTPYYAPKENRNPHIKLANDLIVVHGWAAPKYAAQRHLDLAKSVSVIFHHTHRIDYRMTTMFNGKPLVGMSAGCLCNKSPKYAHGGSPTDWNHGFWVAYIGRYSFVAYPIHINHKYQAVLPDGTEVSYND